jgi:hypothetical protein
MTGTPIDYSASFARANGPMVQSKGIPVDSSGMVSTWSLPSYMLSTNGNKAPVLWYDTGHHAEKVHVPGPGEHSGPGSDITQVHSFDINSTPEQVMKEFVTKSQTNPDEFRALQHLLADAGFFGVDSHIYGGWNTQTEHALASAMEKYLQVSEGAGVPVSFMQYLQNTADANTANGNAGIAGGGGSGGSIAKVPHPTLTDPDQLTFYAQKAAQAALGRNLSQPELTQFIDQFHQQQIDSFNQSYSGTGNPIDKTDARSSASAFVSQDFKPEMQKHQATGYADAFLNMFLSGPSAAPNVNVDQTNIGY